MKNVLNVTLIQSIWILEMILLKLNILKHLNNMMTFFSKNGKEIPVRNGTAIPAGSYIRKGTEFEIVESPKRIVIKREWNNLCQTYDTFMSLVDIS